jgi:hypothetical protein
MYHRVEKIRSKRNFRERKDNNRRAAIRTSLSEHKNDVRPESKR